jgi:ABC-type transport system involved in cytochrome c biogenesis permease subunit
VLGVAIAGGMLWGLRWRWQNRPPIFARSKEEFRQNFDRIKGVLVRSPRNERTDEIS